MKFSERERLFLAISVFIIINLGAINIYKENINIFYLVLCTFLLALSLFFYKKYHKISEWLAWFLSIASIAFFMFTVNIIVSLLKLTNTV